MNQAPFEGRVALVTGGSRGIGRQVALDLAERGADVVINYRGNKAAADEVLERIQGYGRRALALQADVSDFAQASEMVQQAVDAMGRLDILVNNAGVTRDTLLMRLSEDDWDLVIDTVLKGTCACSKAALRPMMRQRYGRIINIGSVSGLAGNPDRPITAPRPAWSGLPVVTKPARNITVNLVVFGMIATEMTAGLPEPLMAEVVRNTPFGRLASRLMWLPVFLPGGRRVYH